MTEFGVNRGITANVTQNDLLNPMHQMFNQPIYDYSLLTNVETAFTASNLESDGPYTFQINANDFQYIQTNSMLLEMEFLVKKGSADLAGTDIVAPVNNILWSVFSHATVSINKELISGLTQENIAYKAYLENLISFSPEKLRTGQATGGFVMDKAKYFEGTSSGSGANASFNTRKNWIALSKTVQVIDRLPIDCLQLDGLFPPRIPIDITLHKSKTDFHLMSNQTTNATAKYKLIIKKLKLHVNYIDLSLEHRAQHMSLWEKNPFSLPFSKVVVKHKQFARGLSSLDFDSCFNGILPNTVVCGMVDSSAFDGALNKNPFNFKHNSLNEIYFKVNNATIPSERITCDFGRHLTARAYRYLFDNTGQSYRTEGGSFITPTMFENGCALFAFDLTPDKCNGYHQHPHEKGNLDIKISLYSALTTQITLIVLGTFSQYLILPKEKRAYIEYV